MKIHAQPGLPPTPSNLIKPYAKSPEKAPDSDAAEKNKAIRSCNSRLGIEYDEEEVNLRVSERQSKLQCQQKEKDMTYRV